MNTGRTVFSQLVNFLPRHEFNKCVQGNLSLLFERRVTRKAAVIICFITIGK